MKATKSTKILHGALIIVTFAGIRSEHAATCIGATSTGPEFQSITFMPQTNTFTFEVDATPSASRVNFRTFAGIRKEVIVNFENASANSGAYERLQHEIFLSHVA